jgi:hypothetical protein
MLGLQPAWTPARSACLIGSQPGCLKGVTGTGVTIVRPWSKWSKVAPQRFQCVPLLIDFTHRAHTAPSEERDRWAPALKRMLKQESRDDDRHREEALIDKDAKNTARQRQRCGVRLQGPFDVPFFVEFVEAAVDALGVP